MRKSRSIRPFRLAGLVLAAASASALAACDPDQTPTSPEGSFVHSTGPNRSTFYGAAVKVGDGLARTYFVKEGETVLEVGVALTEAALRNLPQPGEHGEHGGRVGYTLAMHPQNPTPYRFVGMDWAPEGHVPPGIYDRPHFDVHFYTISEAARDAIDRADPLWDQKAARFPSPEYIPQGYLDTSAMAGITPGQAAEPRMGLHWADPSSPEYHGAPFTRTLIVGTWDGEVIFAEPMVTRALLETRSSSTAAIPPARKGYLPGSYRVYWDADRREHRIALTQLPAGR